MAKDNNFKPEYLLTASNCLKCGAALGAPERGKYTCEYCGTTFLPRELIGGKSIDLQTFYERAFAAVEENDYGRAYEYFKRILETDAAEHEAWAGKGIAGAYARLSDTQQLKAGEVLSCMDMALAHYDGDDEAAFQSRLGDRVGALAVDLYHRVTRERVNDEENLRAVLDLLAYWEERGTEELECWTAIVAVAEKPSIPPKSQRSQGVAYFAFNYPFEKVAHEYAEKIRAKYDPAFTNAFERKARARASMAKVLLTVAAIVVTFITLSVLSCCILGGLISLLGA